ncbi:type II toxin-antitoxin system RelE/ParE family toxin [Candidatus Jorgensenbacteria bacterium CG10_big_fil_rev_8_21_14_0_10_54_38]|uniref:Type II toxin-antitoxin system RelE/ParE family toxin n=2 Tax=Candidatus Joergenseniibacteriota TaxID=1752739 RepID=A0A2M6WGB6_9BACT|nr:MAG: plasmid stabilization protein [Candidatus Jorgensenbacteria bacterium CG23_combo_of_CG06-09_8_20_14_all_54_14]PIT91819.1 MAG: type II toxin-antitoxin system RelE/ParE family toxin [Candidatus Jorgensenbacteria bacterium CG10_big_fil_rev_8_21_14_0_10_54_38]
MDKIEKALRKLTNRERSEITALLSKLKSKKYQGLDIKKLKGSDVIYRIRKGSLRIIYRISEESIFILAIERRRENTYKFTG